jgi:hypothetical protein
MSIYLDSPLSRLEIALEVIAAIADDSRRTTYINHEAAKENFRGCDSRFSGWFDLVANSLLLEIPKLAVATREGNPLGEVGTRLLRLYHGYAAAKAHYQLAACIAYYGYQTLLPGHAGAIGVLQKRFLTLTTGINREATGLSFQSVTDPDQARACREAIRSVIEVLFRRHTGIRQSLGPLFATMEVVAGLCDQATDNLSGASQQIYLRAQGILEALDAPGSSNANIVRAANESMPTLEAILRAADGILPLLTGMIPICQSIGPQFDNVTVVLRQIQ